MIHDFRQLLHVSPGCLQVMVIFRDGNRVVGLVSLLQVEHSVTRFRLSLGDWVLGVSVLWFAVEVLGEVQGA